MNFRKQFWIKAGIGIFAVLLIVSVLQSFGKKHPTQTPFFSATPTPIQAPLPFGANKYTDPDNHYEMYYPAEWTIANDENSYAATTLKYTENNQEYSLQITHTTSVLQSNGEQFDNIDTTAVSYGGRKFKRVTWWKNEKPVRIAVLDDDSNAPDIYNFIIDLPPTNTEKYIGIFNNIVQNFKILSPAPLPDDAQP